MTPSPECGTIAGRTRFLVFYRVADGIDMAEFESCCRLHEPPGFMILTDEAEVIQIDVTDGYERSIFTDTDLTTMRNPQPGHYINPGQLWAWTLINGLRPSNLTTRTNEAYSRSGPARPRSPQTAERQTASRGARTIRTHR